MISIDLSGKNALVCGASQGIGRACAIALAKAGARVTAVARNTEKLSELMKELSGPPVSSHQYLVLDLKQTQEVRMRVHQLALQGPIHILINNTGGPPPGPAIKAEEEEYLDAFRQHLICNQIITSTLISGMKAASYGRIINIISTSVKQPIDNLGVSNTIRAAVASWAKTLANELGQYNITVNNILPGATQTERLEEIIRREQQIKSLERVEIVRKLSSSIPMGRFGQPQEIASAALFLASPLASYINGINLPVDGGRTKCL